MRIQNTETAFGSGSNRGPWDEYGEAVPSGSFLPAAPLMSRYSCVLAGSEALYVRVASNGATADWAKIINATGSFAISGTLTVGDLVITA